MRKLSSLLVLGALALAATAGAASAATVNFDTVTGSRFLSNNSTAISNNGITITYNPATVIGLTTDSNTNFGSFTITGTGNGGNFSDTFVLQVNQTLPLPGGGVQFGNGTVSGVITVSSGSAFVQFTSPLTVSVPGAPTIQYAIRSADSGTPGRVDLKFPDLQSQTPDNTTTIQGRVTAVPVPAAAWAGLSMLGGLGAFGAVRRRRMA
jgi:hypothetical protein